MTEHDALLILNAISGMGPIRIRQVIDFYGSAVNALSRDHQAIFQDGVVPDSVKDTWENFNRDQFLNEEYALLNRHDVHVVTMLDAEYPALLKQIPDAPVVLYVNGALNEENSGLALVGSRRASSYGLAVAENMAVRCVENALTVVSGLARGIDTAAHKGALKAKGRTIAVLGCGLATVYPPENKNLMFAIAETGAVVSEYPMHMEPLAFNFPRRNRIISGLSLGVVVVEAARKSGALITADCAIEQGREVFAVPGKIDNPSAEGVHGLIKQGAKLITSFEDILEEIAEPLERWLNPETKEKEIKTFDVKPKAPPVALSHEEALVADFIAHRTVHIDEIIENCQNQISSLGTVLFQLEIKKVVVQLPGKLYVRRE